MNILVGNLLLISQGYHCLALPSVLLEGYQIFREMNLFLLMDCDKL